MTIIQAQPLKTYGITGPASATDNEVPLFSGSSGKIIKDGSGLSISSGLMQAENKALLLAGATGATPTSGAGTRMMWVPDKKAFRVGEVAANEWNFYLIGKYSFAYGLSTEASEFASFCGGYNSLGILQAAGSGSYAQGYVRTRDAGTNPEIVSIGKGSFAQGVSLSGGGGFGSLRAQGAGSFAQGNVEGDGFEGRIFAQGNGAFAQGFIEASSSNLKIEALGDGSFAHGNPLTGDTLASGDNSMAIGDDVSATQSGSIIFGLSCTNVTANSMRVGWSANGGVHIKNQELWFGDSDVLFALDIGSTNGLQIGKAASQKLGFFGATPVTQRLKADYNNWAGHSDIVNALVSLGLFDQA